jgi:alkanesulfonate monooxygenase SsuD/methylene tetrahydromethanopterin reductase-like flavin-dependent oxidoreductase (luciferase family)
MKLQRDWSNLGAESFEFEVLETLERAETQTGEAFAEDLDVLKDYWLEKLKEKLFY